MILENWRIHVIVLNGDKVIVIGNYNVTKDIKLWCAYWFSRLCLICLVSQKSRMIVNAKFYILIKRTIYSTRSSKFQLKRVNQLGGYFSLKEDKPCKYVSLIMSWSLLKRMKITYCFGTRDMIMLFLIKRITENHMYLMMIFIGPLLYFDFSDNHPYISLFIRSHLFHFFVNFNFSYCSRTYSLFINLTTHTGHASLKLMEK